jgi:hypothetical protein
VNAKDAAGGDGATQFGRVLSELNMDILCANTPQAKGRVQRAFGTLQDRLVKELRLVGADSGGSRSRIRDDLAQRSDLISPGVPR